MTRDQLIASAEALLDLDAKGALVPRGLGGLAREIIEGFLALASAQPEIKGLEWYVNADNGDTLAKSICGTYVVSFCIDDERGEWLTAISPQGDNLGDFATTDLDPAKAVCQSHLAATIRTALAPSVEPGEPDEIRNEIARRQDAGVDGYERGLADGRTRTLDQLPDWLKQKVDDWSNTP